MNSGCNFDFSFELVLSGDSPKDLLTCRERFILSPRSENFSDTAVTCVLESFGGGGGGAAAVFARTARKRVLEFLRGNALTVSLVLGLRTYSSSSSSSLSSSSSAGRNSIGLLSFDFGIESS